MSGGVGRLLLVKKNAVVILGIRTATVAWSGESIDITSGEDNGFRLLLENSGQEQLDLSIEGIMKEETLRLLTIGGGTLLLTDITITWPGGASLAGDFRLSSYEEGAPYNDAITFSATLESSGEWVYTPEV